MDLQNTDIEYALELMNKVGEEDDFGGDDDMNKVTSMASDVYTLLETNKNVDDDDVRRC